MSNKPENELLFMVLEPKQLKNGSTVYTGFLGLNSVSASIYQEKLFIKLVKWPKKEQQQNNNPVTYQNEDDIAF